MIMKTLAFLLTLGIVYLYASGVSLPEIAISSMDFFIEFFFANICALYDNKT